MKNNVAGLLKLSLKRGDVFSAARKNSMDG